MVDPERMHRRHLQNGGRIPSEIFRNKKAFMLDRPTGRPAQSYSDFSRAAAPFVNPLVAGKVFGGRARLDADGAEYVALIGLRADEQLRVDRVQNRSQNPHANAGYEGERVMVPLRDMNIQRADVEAFWERQPWDLGLEMGEPLSNCVYCFLKGPGNLRRVRELMETHLDQPIPGFGPTRDTPSDIRWWERMELLYGRDLDLESGGRTSPEGNGRIGFMGLGGPTYGELALRTGPSSPGISAILPCDCTE